MSEKTLSGGEYLVTDTDCRNIFTPEDFSDEHRQIAETTEQFVVNEIWPINDEIESKNFDLVVENLQKCGELGLLMVDAPEEHGGLELDKVTCMIVTEKLAPAKNFSVAHLVHTGIGMLPLIYYGTKEQKERYLEKLMSGECIAAYCLTEPGSGSDALGAQSTAILSEDGSHYILNGTKQFISNVAFADLFTVFAKVDKKHFSAFLVERSFAGLEFGPEEKKMGMHGSSTSQVILNDVQVPVENLLGEVGRGHKIAFNVLNVGRFKLGAMCVGQMKYALAEGASYSNDRKQFNVPINSFGAIREKLADVTAMAFASESVVYRLAGMIDDRLATVEKGGENYYTDYQKGIEDYSAECAIAKVFCTEHAAGAIDEMLQVHGGYGYIAEYPIEQLYRDERVQRIYEGTNEINRLLIPGVFIRRGISGKAVHESLGKPASGTFAGEKELLGEMKGIYHRLADHTVEKFGASAGNEQEICLALADVAIQIFALESVLLRVEKNLAAATASRKEQLEAVLKVCFYSTRQKFINAAEQSAAFLEDDSLQELVANSVQCKHYGLLTAKRLLADATSEAEKYIF
jgi:alkylation response protein AidB-like acyl-CoA dehydrogenase